MPQRSPEEIRASIEANRAALVTSVDNARNEVARLTDWRGYIAEHRQQITVGAAAAGFLVGGALVLRGLRRRR
jgi:dienelactone hydrolase